MTTTHITTGEALKIARDALTKIHINTDDDYGARAAIAALRQIEGAQDAPADDMHPKQEGAYKTLVASLRSQLAHVQKEARQNAEAVNTLASERAANAQLTAELEMVKCAPDIRACSCLGEMYANGLRVPGTTCESCHAAREEMNCVAPTEEVTRVGAIKRTSAKFARVPQTGMACSSCYGSGIDVAGKPCGCNCLHSIYHRVVATQLAAEPVVCTCEVEPTGGDHYIVKAICGLCKALNEDDRPRLSMSQFATLDDYKQAVAEHAAPLTEPPLLNSLGLAESWSVTVEANGERVLCISDQHYAGASDTEPYHATIENCAQHLLSFIGAGQQAGGDVVDAARQLAIGKAIERACAELPMNFEVEVMLERDAGTVRLCIPDGFHSDEHFDADTFDEQINNAIDAARAASDAKGDA